MSLSLIVNIFLHLDKYLNVVLAQYNTWAYALVFFVIFIETGLVVTPFLPGDSLIFAIGAIAASGGPVSIPVILLLLYLAAIGGDSLNYEIGHLLRERVEKRENIRFVRREYIDRTEDFFDRYGTKAITIARFVPIIRTFAPFIAGVGKMHYLKFLTYNVIGAVLWVTLMFSIGFFFGNIPLVKNHFSLVLIAIIVISLIPAVLAFFTNRGKSSSSKQANAEE
jgi:membrane-associated protein